jgi:hypothetical protein
MIKDVAWAAFIMICVFTGVGLTLWGALWLGMPLVP